MIYFLDYFEHILYCPTLIIVDLRPSAIFIFFSRSLPVSRVAGVPVSSYEEKFRRTSVQLNITIEVYNYNLLLCGHL